MNSEKVIKSFYGQYKKAHELVEQNVSNTDDKQERINLSSRLLDRIIILLFINDTIYDEELDLFDSIKSTYTDEKLFNKILSFYNNPLRCVNNRADQISMVINLFPIDRLEEHINISDEILEDIIRRFSKYSWILEGNFEKNNNQITPDILGKIFEKYINQRETGAYYTEEDTIQYINSNSIIFALLNKINQKEILLNEIRVVLNRNNINNIEELIKDNVNLLELLQSIIEITNSYELLNDLRTTLEDIKILDPTCGTGAFLVSALDILKNLYVLVYNKLNEINNDIENINNLDIVINIISNNLYGVDIMEDAIDIAKFRLYLKVLQNLNDENYIENITFNLKSGNSLYGRGRREYQQIEQLAITIDDEFIDENRFDWDSEFSDIIYSGGFDCVVGNPPYVEYSKIRDSYKIEEFKTFECKNIYAYVIERSLNLLNEDGVIGFIVPISIVSTPRMKELRGYIESNCSDIFYSNFGDRPATLFNGVHQKLSILIARKGHVENTNIYTSQYYHWYNNERPLVFSNIRYYKNTHRDPRFYYKLGNGIQESILNKINSIDNAISDMIVKEDSEHIAYLNDRMTFWMKCFITEQTSNSFKRYPFRTEEEKLVFIALMNSSLYYLFWETISDVWHITRKELELFKFDYNRLTENQKQRLIDIVNELEIDLENNKVYIGSAQVDYEYKHKKSKLIIDKIDRVLKEYYGFTDEEYNYIIDYGLAYRMNDELEFYLQQRENINTQENNHMNVIDLFSGAGGFTEGFRKAGFDVLVANEIDPMIANTHHQNHPETLMVNLGIEEFADDVEGVLNQQLENIGNIERANYIRNNINNIDVIIGGPPCQGFSMAGARNRQVNNQLNEFMEDPRNYLFRHYFRMIQHFEPNYFIMENVQGLESMNGGAILREIISLFEDENNFNNGRYYLNRKVISADELGVPQGRKRLIIIGSKFGPVNIEEGIERVKQRLNIPERVTIEDAISDLNDENLESGSGELNNYPHEPLTDYQIARRENSNGLYNHIAPNHNEAALDRIRRIGPGQNWRDLEEAENIRSVHSGSYGRLEWDNQSPTITTRFDTPSAGRVIHPERNRALTPREAARIQSFDDSFVFYGNRTSVGKQIGNAVPPLVAKVLANVILDDMEERNIDR